MNRLLGIALLGAASMTFQVLEAQSVPLTLLPGLTVRNSVYGGHDSSGKLLGDYESVNQYTEVSAKGFRYQFHMVGLAAKGLTDNDIGSQFVSAEDIKHGTHVHEYYGARDESQAGFVCFWRLSDATYADLKAGRETPLGFDGPQNPRALKPIGYETLTTLIDEKRTTVRTIKTLGKARGSYWVLDNPNMPLVIKMANPEWKSMVTSITTPGASSRALISDLDSSGSATTHAILFAYNSAEIAPDSFPVIDSLAQYLKKNVGIQMEIDGHTDNIGGAAVNQTLSEKRATAVKTYLVSHGIDAARLITKGFGLTTPIADNAQPEGRAQNRRVVFKRL